MKRDPELVRQLLFYFELKNSHQGEWCPSIEGHTELEIKYHLLLLAQAGFIDYEPEITKTGRIIHVLAFGLTWEGHEFLEASRDETRWKKVTSIVLEKGGGLTFDVLKRILIREALDAIGG